MRSIRRVILVFLAAIVIIGGGGYILTKANSLLSDFRQFFETKVQSEYNLDVRVASIKGGITGPIILNGITISRRGNKDDVLFKANRVFIGARFWEIGKIKNSWQGQEPRNLKISVSGGEVFFNEFFRLVTELKGSVVLRKELFSLENVKARFLGVPVYLSGSVYGLKQEPTLDMQIVIYGIGIRGPINLSGGLKKPRFDGSLDFVNVGQLSLKGNIEPVKDGFSIRDFEIYASRENKKNDIRPDSQDLELPSTLSFIFGSSGGFENTIKVAAEHLRLGNNDFIGTIDIKTKTRKNQKGEEVLLGELSASSMLFNYKPIAESECSFKVTKNGVEILYYKFGNSTRAYGTIDFTSPVKLDLFLNIDYAELSDIFSFLSDKEADAFNGLVNGQVSVSGPVNEVKTKGHLGLGAGKAGDLFFESANINFEGKGSVIKFSDSRFIKENMDLILEGELDLRNIFKSNYLEGISIRTKEGVVVWEGWDPSKGASEASFKSSDRFEFGTYANEGMIGSDQKQKSGVELEYKLGSDSNKRIKMRYEEGDQFLGLERKVKF